MSEINPQKTLFESIHETYLTHFFAKGALYWKRRLVWSFIQDSGVQIDGKKIGEFFCGSGFNTKELMSKFKPELVMGFDISEAAVKDYKNVTGQGAFQADLSKDFISPQQFDNIFVFGGLHHAYFDLDRVLLNISKALVPGGHLVVYEPLRNTIWDVLRNFWYKHDRYFDASSEYPLVPEEVEKHHFKKIKVKYITGPGYLIIYNSMILRIPVRVANALSIPLTLTDQFLSFFKIKFLSFCFVGIYKKEASLSSL
jgi:SAM-dependent methyltransferase